jgi:N6-adenosine-specific RNA methylase IME4
MEKGGGKIKRGADRHYKLLKVPDIIRVMTQAEPWNEIGDDAHMYLWVTNNHLQNGLKVMEALGFRYVTNVCWVKGSFGLGQYFRGQHELCLFGVRGRGFSVRSNNRSISSVLKCPKGPHSAKPEDFYAMVEKRSEGPFLEMFARQRRSNWTVWGDEIPEDE